MEAAPPNKSKTKKKFGVLVIDDNQWDRELTARHLGRAWPFEQELMIDYAVNGLDALDRMRTTRFAMIVLDWKLPGMGGGEVLRHIRQNGVHIPVIVISGLQREAINEDLNALGAAFLNKDEMDPHHFYEAIAASMKLMGLTQPSTT